MASTFGIARALFAEIAGEPLEVEPLALRHVGATERREEHAVGRVERARVRVLVQRAARGRAARLEHDPERAAGVPRSQRAQRLVHGGRVVREVVVDAHAAGLAEEVLPAPHALERREGRARLVDARRRSPRRTRRSPRGRCARCGRPGTRSAKRPHDDAAREEIERLRSAVRPAAARARRATSASTSPVSSPLERVPGDSRARLARDDRARARVVRVAHERARPRGRARTNARNAASYDATSG